MLRDHEPQPYHRAEAEVAAGVLAAIGTTRSARREATASAQRGRHAGSTADHEGGTPAGAGVRRAFPVDGRGVPGDEVVDEETAVRRDPVAQQDQEDRAIRRHGNEDFFEEDLQAHRHQGLSLRQPGGPVLLAGPCDVVPHRAQLGDVTPLLLVRVDGARHVDSRSADVHAMSAEGRPPLYVKPRQAVNCACPRSAGHPCVMSRLRYVTSHVRLSLSQNYTSSGLF